MNVTRTVLSALVVVTIVSTASRADATVVERLSTDELIASADLVVHARVVDRRVLQQRGPRGEIYTQTTLRVLARLKGSSAATIVVQQIGGTLGDTTMAISGDARLSPGEEVVAFLTEDRARGLTFVVGLAQGVFHVTSRGRLFRDLTGLSVMERGGITPGTLADDGTLAALRATLQGSRR